MSDGRYAPNSGHSFAPQRTPLWANSDISPCGRLVSKAQAVLSEFELFRAMFDVGYFPPNTPPQDE
jgi:hypothetical protein